MANTSKSLRSYDDVKALLNQAATAGGLRLEFRDYRIAAAFVGRANAYRRLLRERNERDFGEYSSDFDSLLFTREKESNIVVIRAQMLPVTIQTLSGEVLPMPPIIETPSHDLPLGKRVLSPSDLDFLDEMSYPSGEADDLLG